MQGNIGKGIVKVSSVEKEYWKIKAPALVFNNQTEFYNAYKDGALHKAVSYTHLTLPTNA